MPYFQVDDQLHSHPKAVAAGNAAMGLWVRMGSYCSAYKTDGKVLKTVAKTFGKPREFQSLLSAGLLTDDGDFWSLPGYLEHNWTSEQVEEKRRQARERKRRQRERQSDVTPNVTRDIGEDMTRESQPPSQAKPSQANYYLTDIAAAQPVSELPEAAAAAIEIYINHRMRMIDPIHPNGLRKKLRNDVPREHGQDLIDYLSEHPDAEVVDLACDVLGMGPVDFARVTHPTEATA